MSVEHQMNTLYQLMSRHNQVFTANTCQDTNHLNVINQQAIGIQDILIQIKQQMMTQNIKSLVQTNPKYAIRLTMRSLITSSLSDLLTTEDKIFLSRSSSKLDGMYVTSKGGKYQFFRHQNTNNLTYELINNQYPIIIPEVDQDFSDTFTGIPFVPFKKIMDQNVIGNSQPSMSSFLCQQALCQQIQQQNLLQFHKQNAKILAEACSIYLQNKVQKKIQKPTDEAILVKQVFTQLTQNIDEQIKQYKPPKQIFDDFQQQLMKYLSEPKESADLQTLEQDILIVKLRYKFHTKVFGDYERLFQILPTSKPSLQLRHLFSDETLLQKATVIYILLALFYNRRKIVVSLPLSSLKTIPQIIVNFSVQRLKFQNKNVSNCLVYCSQQNINDLLLQLTHTLQNTAYHIICQDTQRVVYSNRENSLKHEMFMIDCQSESMAFNFKGVPDLKNQLQTFDRSVNVLIITYDYYAKVRQQALKQMKAFLLETHQTSFNAGLLHVPTLVVPCPCEQKIVVLDEFVQNHSLTALNLINIDHNIDYLYQFQQNKNLRTAAKKYVECYSYKPDKGILDLSLPQQKIVKLNLKWKNKDDMKLHQLLKRLVMIYQYLVPNPETENIGNVHDQIGFYTKQLKKTLQNIRVDQQQNTKNVAKCLTCSPLQFCKNFLENFLDKVKQVKKMGNSLMCNQNLTLANLKISIRPVPLLKLQKTSAYSFVNNTSTQIHSEIELSNLMSSLNQLIMNLSPQTTNTQQFAFPSEIYEVHPRLTKRQQLIAVFNSVFKIQAHSERDIQQFTLKFGLKQSILYFCAQVQFNKLRCDCDYFNFAEQQEQPYFKNIVQFETGLNLNSQVFHAKFQNVFSFNLIPDFQTEKMERVSITSQTPLIRARGRPNTSQTQVQQSKEYIWVPVQRLFETFTFHENGVSFSLTQKQLTELKLFGQNVDLMLPSMIWSQQDCTKLVTKLISNAPKNQKILIITSFHTEHVMLNCLIKSYFGHKTIQVAQPDQLMEADAELIIITPQDNQEKLIKKIGPKLKAPQTIYCLKQNIPGTFELPFAQTIEDKLLNISRIFGGQYVSKRVKALDDDQIQSTKLIKVTQHVQRNILRYQYKFTQIEKTYYKSLQMVNKTSRNQMIYVVNQTQLLNDNIDLLIDYKKAQGIKQNNIQRKAMVQQTVSNFTSQSSFQPKIAFRTQVSELHQAFAFFRERLDYLGHLCVQNPDGKKSYVPLLIPLNPTRRLFIPRCCTIEIPLNHLLPLLQQSSKTTPPQGRIALQNPQNVFLQPMNYLMVNLQLFQHELQVKIHQDVKSLVFMLQVTKNKMNKERQPSNWYQNLISHWQSQEVMYDAPQIIGINWPKIKAQIIDKLQEVNRKVFQLDNIKQTKDERLYMIHNLYYKYQENNRISISQQNSLAEHAATFNRDQNASVNYQNIQDMVFKVLNLYVPQKMEEDIHDAAQRIIAQINQQQLQQIMLDHMLVCSAQPATNLRFQIKLFKSLAYNAVKMVDKKKTIQFQSIDFLRYKNSDQLFVNQCALAMRNPVKDAPKSIKLYQQLVDAHGNQMARFVIGLEGQGGEEE
ncbi:Conserved_hypothetical protein [Hexamita inflata]|uniref:Uncharacterized protein n=1 Tax=Hexamita inflata TaxID=28002 RepID=A0AA86TNU6_9EUKA|nr:Conserved hypothetical protein [Hexamita inflata]